MVFTMPVYERRPDHPLLCSLCCLFFLCGCAPSEEPRHFKTHNVRTGWSNGQLHATIQQQLTLSSDARDALIHGVPLTVMVELVLRNSSESTRIWKHREEYEIRYLPLSNHFQLTLPAGKGVKTYPRLRHALAELATIDVKVGTGVLPEGEYELLERTRLDQQKMPPPMRLPVLFSSQWRHDSDWTSWPLKVHPSS